MARRVRHLLFGNNRQAHDAANGAAPPPGQCDKIFESWSSTQLRCFASLRAHFVRLSRFAQLGVRFVASQQPVPEAPQHPRFEASQRTYCSTGFSRNLGTCFTRAAPKSMVTLRSTIQPPRVQVLRSLGKEGRRLRTNLPRVTPPEYPPQARSADIAVAVGANPRKADKPALSVGRTA